MGKREKKVEEQPKICPLLSIATAKEDEWNDCEKERCAFYLEKLPSKMEKCVFVRIAVSLGMIAERKPTSKPTSFLEQRLKARLQSLKKQQSP